MKHSPLLLILALSAVVPTLAQDQQASANRSETGLQSLRAAVSVLGGAPPTDSVVSLNVALTDGQSASLLVKTKGIGSTSEHFVAAEVDQVTVFSQGVAKGTANGEVKETSLESASSSDSCIALLPLLSRVLANTDYSVEFVGTETVGGKTASHIQFRNTFSSQPKLGSLVPFTTKDIWIDSTTNLPLRISYEQRSALGAVAGTAVQLDFSNYKSVGGYVLPYTITRSFNGSYWGTLTIQNAQFNTGLTDAEFSVD